MDCSQTVITLLLLVPCAQGGGEVIDPSVAGALAVPEPPRAELRLEPTRPPDPALEPFYVAPDSLQGHIVGGGPPNAGRASAGAARSAAPEAQDRG